MEPEWAQPELQTVRSELRKAFIQSLEGLIGKDCKIKMFDKSIVSAQFKGWDLEFQNVLVCNLQTPAGTLNSAILRDIDIVHIDFIEDIPAIKAPES